MKFYIISGEASGDLHGANLVKELKKNDSTFEARGWGGDKMQAEGVVLAKHYKDLAFMGFFEVLMNLRTILKNFKFCKEDAMNYKPDAVILIDYAGFNLRIAKFFHEQGIKVFFYIPPQVWAWKEGRVAKIKKYVNHLFVILPFEKAFYEKHNYKVDYVGNPVLDEISNYRNQHDGTKFREENGFSDKKIIALLPGSRTQEINKKLPIMLSVVDSYPQYEFVIAGAPGQEKEIYEKIIDGKTNVKILFNQTYPILNNSHAALVTSGTATLETALFEIPQVVCYKSSAISMAIAKKLVKIKYISLVNIILDKEMVRELIQEELNTKQLKLEFEKIVTGKSREEMIVNYKILLRMLGGEGASKKTAQLIYFYLQK